MPEELMTQLHCLNRSCAVIFLGLFYGTEVLASSASSGAILPYETWLMALQKSLTGPVAFSVSLIGIVCCGATLIFAGGEINRFMRSLIYIVMVMTLLIGANSLMTNFFNGASLGSELSPLNISCYQLPPHVGGHGLALC